MQVDSPIRSWPHRLEFNMRCLGKWMVVAAIAYSGLSFDSAHSAEVSPVSEVGAGRRDTCLVVVPGDLNQTGTVTSADIIHLIKYLFTLGPEPEPCTYAADLDCSAHVTTADLIGLINYVFKGGQAPCDICSAERPYDCVLGP